jgi:hypothetical protein
MTIQEFVARLSNANVAEWRIESGRIRCDVGGRFCCPITVLGTVKWPSSFGRVAKKIGLSENDAERIAVAADGLIAHSMYDPALRRQLLQTTGLA